MPKRKEGPKTWRYSMDFKARAVEMSLQEGVQVQQVADGLGIHPFMLSRWRREYREGTIVRDRRRRMDVMGTGKKKAAVEENGATQRLERENARLKKENELLKKWQRYLAAQHRSGSASWTNTRRSSASDTCADGPAGHTRDFRAIVPPFHLLATPCEPVGISGMMQHIGRRYVQYSITNGVGAVRSGRGDSSRAWYRTRNACCSVTGTLN